MKQIHFVGIKGVGMTPLAIIAKEAGFDVSGSDSGESFITDVPLAKAGIAVFPSFDPSHIAGADLVIYTAAHGGFDNPEVVKARELKIKTLSQGQAVGQFMGGTLFGRTYTGISIAGCHGKTSTTAIVATVLQKAHLDPTYVIGTSDIVSLPAPGHFGTGNFFVAEADEYVADVTYDRQAKFLYQFPTYGIITNIEFDHPDVYTDIEQLKQTYLKFTKNITSDGLLIVNGDDLHTKEILPEISTKVLTFGKETANDVVIHDSTMKDGKMIFSISFRGDPRSRTDGVVTEYGPFSLSVLGEHNVFNATIAVIIGLLSGLTTDMIQAGLTAFKGTKRRLEFIKKLSSGALLYDDYGHHPTEIATSLKALKEHYPEKKIVCIFQPHTYSRTKQLFDEFALAFKSADEVLLAPIFPSAREMPDGSVSSDQLARAVGQTQSAVFSLPDMVNMIKYINDKAFDNGYIVVIMGAGDIYKIVESLV